MHFNRAEEEDKKAAERWKGDAYGVPVFVRCNCCGTCFHAPRRGHMLIISYHRLVLGTVAASFVGTYPSLQPSGIQMFVLSRHHHRNLDHHRF